MADRRQAASGLPCRAGRGTAPALPMLLLDSFTHTPKFAGWVGGKLRSAYTGAIIRIRRASDNATLDVSATDGLTDTASIAAFCAGTTGYLVTLYDQSGNGNHITQATTTKQPIVYASAALKTGANGYLAALFDGVDDWLSRGDALGLSGDTNLTLIGDCAATVNDGTSFGALLSISEAGGSPTLAYAFDQAFGDGPDTNFGEVDGLAAYAYSLIDASMPGQTGWLQMSRAAGQTLAQISTYTNGVANSALAGSGANPFGITGSAVFAWGAYPDGSEPVFGGSSGKAACVLAFNAALSASEQAALDTWMTGHHA